MAKTNLTKTSLAIFAILACATAVAQEPLRGAGQPALVPDPVLDVSRIIFGSNLISDPCATCNYSDGGGYAVVGPDNCINPGITQWLAGTFIASATGVAERISAAIILRDPRNCPENKVTLSIYTDACYPEGPRRPLASGIATVPEAPCDLAVAKLGNPPTLTKNTKYWVVATTSSQQSALDSNWYGSNNSQYAFDTGTGWQHFTGGTPAFMVQGSGTVFSDPVPDAPHPAFGGNLFVDPCTGCNYDPNAAGLVVEGPDNCTSPGTTQSTAVPFVAAKSGVPKRISASIVLYHPTSCPQNKVTLSLYTDSCDRGPGTLLVSGVATVPSAPCDLAVAKLRNAPALEKSKKYWVVAAASTQQAGLDALWYGSNFAQFAFGDLSGWIQFSDVTPGFIVQ
ncbi:MAG: hypothetical protein H0X34_08565 [Chthoniobacterales bacterium]|jgi:hypothetical protein|nr:hypothetical protein [Chthoniobacterales bacterium]